MASKRIKIGLGFLIFTLFIIGLFAWMTPRTLGIPPYVRLPTYLGGTPTVAERRIARQARPAPADPAIETKPVDRIAAHKAIAEDYGMHAVYCKWPAAESPAFVPYNWTDNQTITPGAQEFFFVEGGWLFGFVDAPQNTTRTRPPGDVRIGLGGGKPMRHHSVSWSPKEDPTSMECTVEQPVPVQFELNYDGEGHAQVELEGCGLYGEAIFGFTPSITIDSKPGTARQRHMGQTPSGPLTWYGQAGSCTLEGTITLIPSMRTQALTPIQTTLRAGETNTIRIQAPTSLPEPTVEQEIQAIEENIQELQDWRDFSEERIENQLAHDQETARLMETMFDDPRLSPRASHVLEEVLLQNDASIESNENILYGTNPFAEMHDKTIADLQNRLADLKAEQNTDNDDGS